MKLITKSNKITIKSMKLKFLMKIKKILKKLLMKKIRLKMNIIKV